MYLEDRKQIDKVWHRGLLGVDDIISSYLQNLSSAFDKVCNRGLLGKLIQLTKFLSKFINSLNNS